MSCLSHLWCYAVPFLLSALKWAGGFENISLKTFNSGKSGSCDVTEGSSRVVKHLHPGCDFSLWGLPAFLNASIGPNRPSAQSATFKPLLQAINRRLIHSVFLVFLKISFFSGCWRSEDFKCNGDLGSFKGCVSVGSRKSLMRQWANQMMHKPELNRPWWLIGRQVRRRHGKFAHLVVFGVMSNIDVGVNNAESCWPSPLPFEQDVSKCRCVCVWHTHTHHTLCQKVPLHPPNPTPLSPPPLWSAYIIKKW